LGSRSMPKPYSEDLRERVIEAVEFAELAAVSLKFVLVVPPPGPQQADKALPHSGHLAWGNRWRTYMLTNFGPQGHRNGCQPALACAREWPSRCPPSGLFYTLHCLLGCPLPASQPRRAIVMPVPVPWPERRRLPGGACAAADFWRSLFRPRLVEQRGKQWSCRKRRDPGSPR
jgi:hypothetical protein